MGSEHGNSPRKWERRLRYYGLRYFRGGPGVLGAVPERVRAEVGCADPCPWIHCTVVCPTSFMDTSNVGVLFMA